jgi:hypothetical protein
VRPPKWRNGSVTPFQGFVFSFELSQGDALGYRMLPRWGEQRSSNLSEWQLQCPSEAAHWFAAGKDLPERTGEVTTRLRLQPSPRLAALARTYSPYHELE